MNRETLNQFQDTLQGQLDGLILPNMRTDGGLNKGGPDSMPPISVESAQETFNSLLSSFDNRVNAWSLNTVAAKSLITDAVGLYRQAYEGWVRLPLAGDASAAVVKWQEAEHVA